MLCNLAFGQILMLASSLSELYMQFMEVITMDVNVCVCVFLAFFASGCNVEVGLSSNEISTAFAYTTQWRWLIIFRISTPLYEQNNALFMFIIANLLISLLVQHNWNVCDCKQKEQKTRTTNMLFSVNGRFLLGSFYWTNTFPNNQ